MLTHFPNPRRRAPRATPERASGGCACIFVTRNPDEFGRTHAAFLRRGPSVRLIPICGAPSDAEQSFSPFAAGLRSGRAPELNARYTPRGGGRLLRVAAHAFLIHGSRRAFSLWYARGINPTTTRRTEFQARPCHSPLKGLPLFACQLLHRA